MTTTPLRSRPDRPGPSLHAHSPPALGRVAIVLVHPSHPGNVGSAARAMRVMGLSDLRLVAPEDPGVCADPQAIALSSGAQDVLERARVVRRLPDALGDVTLAIAVSAESREFGPVPQDPETCAQRALAELAADPAHRVAFVFGAERVGLSIEQVQLCGMLASIPGEQAYASLNLAQAVQIVAYCLRRAALGPLASTAPPQRMADHAAVEGFLQHLQRALQAVGYLDPAHPKKLMPRLRRLFTRTRLEAEEVDLLRGVCTVLEQAAERAARAARSR